MKKLGKKQRGSITLVSVVAMLEIKYGSLTIKCETKEDFESAMDYIRKEQGNEPTVIHKGPLAEALAQFTNPWGDAMATDINPWTVKMFWQFIESIGDSQKIALEQLVQKRKVEDVKLRKALKVTTNQQLAGILSGISKQAAAHNLPAREVFTIENESSSGKTTKHYVVAPHFLSTAKECNWPVE